MLILGNTARAEVEEQEVATGENQKDATKTGYEDLRKAQVR